MHGVQAIIAQFANINNCTLCVWNGHTVRFVSVKRKKLGPLLCISPHAVHLHKPLAWATRYIPNDVEVIVKARGCPCLAFSDWKPNDPSSAARRCVPRPLQRMV